MKYNLGQKIKEIREENELSQPEFAKAIGVSNGIISGWENNKYEPKASYIKKIAIAFNISADEILGIEQKEKTTLYVNNSFNTNSFNNTKKDGK